MEDKEVQEESHLDNENKEGSEELENKAKEERIPQEVTLTDIELEKLQDEAKEFKDKYLRQVAESENARKRLQKEKEELMKFAVENVIGDFIKPLDQFDKALGFAEAGSDEVKNWALGFKMILEQFKEVLRENGVQPFDANGEFDPHLHEAIETVETDEFTPGTIIEQLSRGYKMGQRLIRPAKVKVAKAPAKKDGDGDKKLEEEN